MTSVFAEIGVKYSLGGKTGCTMASHRLATWAKEKHGLCAPRPPARPPARLPARPPAMPQRCRQRSRRGQEGAHCAAGRWGRAKQGELMTAMLDSYCPRSPGAVKRY
jgi:hypothetical protein